jgi:hypothetical protein
MPVKTPNCFLTTVVTRVILRRYPPAEGWNLRRIDVHAIAPE